jgi:hypothetical protein
MVCTANFDEDPIDLVQAHLSYNATGSQGRIDNSKDFIFRKDSAVQRFSTYLASPDKKNYDYEYTVFYKGGTDKLIVSGKSNESVLTLDTDRLGILRVESEAGLVDWERIRSVIVKMGYGGGLTRKETEFTLTQAQPKQLWVEVIAREVTEPYSFQLTFIDNENRRIEVPEQISRSKRLLVNQPLQEDLEVAIVPAGEFGADGLISKVVVAFRYRDDPNNYNQDDIFILESLQGLKALESAADQPGSQNLRIPDDCLLFRRSDPHGRLAQDRRQGPARRRSVWLSSPDLALPAEKISICLRYNSPCVSRSDGSHSCRENVRNHRFFESIILALPPRLARPSHL